MELRINQISTTGGTQPRAYIDEQVVNDYADAMGEGADFPAVIVFYDGSTYWLADGFHRLAAAVKQGWLKIAADVHQGNRRAAVLWSVGANNDHGLRRTNDDKRRAVSTLLADNEWAAWSDNRIAQQCGVSQPFVSNIRRSLKTVLSDEGVLSAQDSRTFTTKHGTTATMNTANIGRTSEKSTEIIDEDTGAVIENPVVVTTTVTTTRPAEHKRTPDDLPIPSGEMLFIDSSPVKAASTLAGAFDADYLEQLAHALLHIVEGSQHV